MRQFIKIRVVFHTLYIWNEDGDPLFFCISGTSNSLSDCSKIFKKIYRVENFRANVLKLNVSCISHGELTIFYEVFSVLIVVMRELKSKHFVICNNKIPTPRKECVLLSWRAFIRVAEFTVTWSIFVCIIRYMEVMPSTKRWSIAAMTADGKLFPFRRKCHFSWSQAIQVDHTKQERVSAGFILSMTCWRDDASHQYSVT